MSTILDALRKVERDRDPAGEPTLEGPAVSPAVRRRRPFPIAAILGCAVVGFGGGALLSWVTSEPTVEVAALPMPPPAPEIVVPRAPGRVEPPAQEPPAPVAAEPAKAEAPKVEVAPAPPPVAAQPPTGVPPSRTRDTTPPAEVARPIPPPSQPAALAAADKGSVLEPSPFGPARDAIREAGPAVNQAPAEIPRQAAPADQELAALPPVMAPPEPQVEEAPEPAAEPETPAEALFDTGRSPPGAPKVALSFLQWSSDPARRFAFISIDGAPTQRVHEGEVAAGLTVAAITPTGVQFKREGTTFVIRPRH
ncbi:MAG: hypothetical protein IT293_05915 [Deltaproteobacteria bacterium]|nr:hypothetical protein [Deltaproteobacteria bacterium]